MEKRLITFDHIKTNEIDKITPINKNLYVGIWDKSKHIKRDILEILVQNAKEFIAFAKFEDLNIDFEDITITGSIANFNYNRKSDIDIHIIVDFKKQNYDEALLEEYFKSKRNEWNSLTKVKIYGHNVECYVQNLNEPHQSTGVYSILTNQWVKFPKRMKMLIPKVEVSKIVMFYIKKIRNLEHKLLDKKMDIKYDCDLEVNNILLDIKEKRQASLETKYKEYSKFNLAYKILRNLGYMDRLVAIKFKCKSNKMSLKTK